MVNRKVVAKMLSIGCASFPWCTNVTAVPCYTSIPFSGNDSPCHLNRFQGHFRRSFDRRRRPRSCAGSDLNEAVLIRNRIRQRAGLSLDAFENSQYVPRGTTKISRSNCTNLISISSNNSFLAKKLTDNRLLPEEHLSKKAAHPMTPKLIKL